MPIVEINGEKKKVACGPCIRGHRSSKCNHRDRLLIEVRKPGRPLGVCPHPAGSCGCERVVINYVIPKDRPTPSASEAQSPTTFAANSKVQKPGAKARRTVSSLTASVVQKVLDGDPAALANLSNAPADPDQASDSSQPPSATSSSSSTPRVNAADSSRRTSIPDSQTTPVPLDAWSTQWPEFYPRPSTTQSVSTKSSAPPQSSCCCGPSDTDASEPQTPNPATPNPQLPHQQTFDAAFPQFNGTGPFGFPALGQDPYMLETTPGCHGMHGPHNSIHSRMNGHTGQCDCGASCECFACTQHPNNRTTLDYIRYHNELLMRSAQQARSPVQYGAPGHPSAFQFAFPPGQSHPQLPNHHGLPIQFAQPFEAATGMAFSNPMAWPPQSPIQELHTPTTQLEQLQFASTPTMGPPPIPISSTHGMPIPLQAQPQAPPQRQRSLSKPNLQSVPEARRASDTPLPTATTPFDPESPPDDDGSTLSPSSFLLSQFTLPGCDDVTGTCRCGDLCSCEGCLTHSGHKKNTPTTSGAEVIQPSENNSTSFAVETTLAEDSIFEQPTVGSCCGP